MDVLLTIYMVRGPTKTEKQEQLARDIDVYNLDVCCLQETKITDGLDVDIGVKKHKVYLYNQPAHIMEMVLL